jgi:NADPH:quinone reductase-like Zn-dependent oxidoreductase
MAPQKIKQWVTGQDGLDKLRMEETERSTPGQDEVLVEIHSVSLNYRDTEGINQLTATKPCKCRRTNADQFL